MSFFGKKSRVSVKNLLSLSFWADALKKPWANLDFWKQDLLERDIEYSKAGGITDFSYGFDSHRCLPECKPRNGWAWSSRLRCWRPCSVPVGRGLLHLCCFCAGRGAHACHGECGGESRCSRLQSPLGVPPLGTRMTESALAVRITTTFTRRFRIDLKHYERLYKYGTPSAESELQTQRW